MPDNFTLDRNVDLPRGETKASSGFIVDGQLWITGDLTATVYALGAGDVWEAQIQFSQYNEADPVFLGLMSDGKIAFFGRTTGRLFIFDRADGTLVGGDKTVGPALDPSAANAWDAYTMTEALEATAEYGFVARENTVATRTTRTTRLLGSDLIGLTAQADANYADTDENTRTVLIPRVVAGGAIQIHVGVKDLTANELYLNVRDNAYQIVRMVKYP